MCGIAGFVNVDGAPADARVLGAMTDMLRHRGPDDRGTRCVSLRGGPPDTGLGFRRLRIIDTSDDGRQPMMSPDGTIATLLNGEVYNAWEYKEDLERDGHRLRSRTDTEVVLALYERDGLERTLDRLNGMFSIVIADTRRGVVHLIRDHVGVKPLYWGQWGTTVLFASEAKAFLAHPSFKAEIDPSALDELLSFRSIAGERTLLAGVREVPPGHVISITPNGSVTRCYWSIPDNTEKLDLSLEETSDHLAQLLDRSVGAQLRADVKVGCQLSGGLDSSLVTTIAATRQPGLETFSVVCDDPRFSEEPWIAAVTETTGVISHRFMFGATEFVDAMDAASWHFDQPIGHPNSLALWSLARGAREHAAVLLTGEGADELFGGYARVQRHASMSADAFIRATQFHSESRLAKLRPGGDLRPAIERRRGLFDEGRGDHLSNCLKYDMRTHLVNVLMRQDKMMMAHGVENRVPFLDRRVIEFARALPAGHLIGRAGNGTKPRSKPVVKELALRSFDAAFVERRKSGFNLPLAQYFRSRTFVSVMEDRLLPGMASRGLVDVDVVRRWWRRALSAPSTTEGFWICVALESWAQQFLDRRRVREDYLICSNRTLPIA